MLKPWMRPVYLAHQTACQTLDTRSQIAYLLLNKARVRAARVNILNKILKKNKARVEWELLFSILLFLSAFKYSFSFFFFF